MVENNKRKHPDCLADSAIVNLIAASLRLPRYSHGFFSSFSNTPSSYNIFKQAVGPYRPLALLL